MIDGHVMIQLMELTYKQANSHIASTREVCGMIKTHTSDIYIKKQCDVCIEALEEAREQVFKLKKMVTGRYGDEPEVRTP